MIHLELDIEPTSWTPSRIAKGYAYNPKDKEKKAAIRHIKWRMPILQKPIQGFVVLELQFIFSTPKSASKKKRQQMLDGLLFPTQKDCTNMQKFIEDCLKNIAFEDDRYVVQVSSSKIYGVDNKILINVYSIDEYNKGKAPC